MHVSVSSSIDQLNPDVHGSVQQVLQDTLARFSRSISQVSVSVVDENGPRGGVDKLCRVNLMMPGLGTVTANAKREKVMPAVYEAARRARRIVLTKLKRKESLRKRGRSIVEQLEETEIELSGA